MKVLETWNSAEKRSHDWNSAEKKSHDSYKKFLVLGISLDVITSVTFEITWDFINSN